MKRPTLSSIISGIALAGVCTLSLAQAAAALEATATRAVNVRSGPGANYTKVDVLSSGEAVNIKECKSNWCYVEHSGPNGWVSGNYLKADEGASSSSSGGQKIDPALAAILAAILGAVIIDALDDDDPAPTPPTPTPPTPPTPTPPTTVLENGTYTLQQASNGKYLDAHENTAKDFRVVTRGAQNNATQLWVIKNKPNGNYTVQQLSNMRYMDAHEGSHDNSIVTRPAQGNTTQLWKIKRLPNGTFSLRQRSNGRFMDAHEGTNDNDVVTRNAQGNATQQWIISRR